MDDVKKIKQIEKLIKGKHFDTYRHIFPLKWFHQIRSTVKKFGKCSDFDSGRLSAVITKLQDNTNAIHAKTSPYYELSHYPEYVD